MVSTCIQGGHQSNVAILRAVCRPAQICKEGVQDMQLQRLEHIEQTRAVGDTFDRLSSAGFITLVHSKLPFAL